MTPGNELFVLGVFYGKTMGHKKDGQKNRADSIRPYKHFIVNCQFSIVHCQLPQRNRLWIFHYQRAAAIIRFDANFVLSFC